MKREEIRKGHSKNIYRNSTRCDETHVDISREVTRKLKGKRDVPQDHFWLPNELKTSLLRILLSCDTLGCIDYC
jgi:hypothetical protein